MLVAIGMSKHRQEVLTERPEGGRRRRMTVMATKVDYDRLATELEDVARRVIVGFEATGLPSSPCLMTNALRASVNFDRFMPRLLA